MRDWNVVVSTYQEGFTLAIRVLRRFGAVERSPYHNVLVMKVQDPRALLDVVEHQTETDPALYDAISRIAPADCGFEFQSAEDFAEKSKSVVLAWAPKLRGKSFHVRLHRRGAKHGLPSPEVERSLDETVLEKLKVTGTPGTISFSDPDAVIAIDTIDERAGMGLWTRDDLARHRLLRPD
jgi:tRNA(Ser,Leu) C12 N-acetylase TAN1